jgi:hypothetical protein
MSARTASSTDTATIYIPLLNEGTVVFRPAKGLPLGQNTFRVLATDDYDSQAEEWKFPPGSIVECVTQIRDGKEVLVATARLN